MKILEFYLLRISVETRYFLSDIFFFSMPKILSVSSLRKFGRNNGLIVMDENRLCKKQQEMVKKMRVYCNGWKCFELVVL